MDDKTVKISKQFAEDTWELAFGDDAWNKDYTDEDVSRKLAEYSEKALAWDTMYEKLIPPDGEDTEENYELREKMDEQILAVANK